MNFLRLKSCIINIKNINKIDIKHNRFIINFDNNNNINMEFTNEISSIQRKIDVMEIYKEKNSHDYNIIEKFIKYIEMKQDIKYGLKQEKKKPEWLIDI